MLLPLSFVACTPAFRDRLFGHRPSAPAPAVHYVVGEPYQAGGVWRYPREDFAYDETGLATVAASHEALTTDSESFDQMALEAAHPTLQLPALARITNLETGRQVVVRINDRGPASPGRLTEVSRRTAELLGAVGTAPFAVRVQVLEAPSRQLASALQGASPPLRIAVAPRVSIQAEPLGAPPGAHAAGHVRTAATAPVAATAPAGTDAEPVPLRLPEQVTAVPPRPGLLYVACGAFSRLQYAELLRQRLRGLGAQIAHPTGTQHDRPFRVRIGPFEELRQADAALDRAMRAGVSDARIIVE
jgi:rare lipoprotein A